MTNLASAPAYGRPGVLLTGATGFLGGYLLKELVERTEMPIYCLTRSDGTLGVRARLMDNLHFLFGADAVEAWPLERIAIVEGDLAKERFGLSEAGYAELAERTGAVFHAAAMLWHFGKLEQFLKVNVQGTENLARLLLGRNAQDAEPHFDAGGERAALRQPKEPVHGSDFHEAWNAPNVYVETKYEAEKRRVPAMLAGHAVRIFRPGFIMGDSKTGRFKKHITSDAQYLHLQGHIFMRTAPPLYDDDYMDLTPVDYAAAAIVHIAFQPDTPPGTYHVCNPQPILKSQIWDIIRDYGFPVRTVPAERYLEEVLDSDDELFLRGLQSVIVYLGDYEKSPAIFDASETLRRLKGSGISCPPPDPALLRRYLDYCVDIGFLPHPSTLGGLEWS